VEPIVLTDTAGGLTPWHSEQVEAGRILLFPSVPLKLSDRDCQFLLGLGQAEASYHKNIAYRPAQDKVTGAANGSDRERLRRVLKDYRSQAAELVARLLPHYARSWRVDFASFRPFREESRSLSLHARNDLLHIDAFPSRPTQGDRILRFFTNLNPERARVWLTSEPFGALAERFCQDAGLREAARWRCFPLGRAFARLTRRARLRQFARSPYDVLMRRFHDFLKENRQFQETAPKTRVEFPPKSSWLVFTDTASHAVVSGRFALEQTFIVSRDALLRPEQAPLRVLERLVGVSLTWND
jgi:3-deoxy-D-manno-octulosonic acid hydroxylase-like protein